MQHVLDMSWVGRTRRVTVQGMALGVLSMRLLADDAPTETPSEETVPTAPKAPVGKSEYARKISGRNAFGLQDPVPPAPITPPPAPLPPPPPKSNVQVTGFSRWGGKRSVYLMVARPDSKAPKYYTLEEGSEQADIKVLRIDEQNETVVIVNTGVEETLNFKDNGAKAAPSATPIPNAPGGGNPGAPGSGNAPTPVVNRYVGGGGTGGGASGPTVIGRGGVVDSPAASAPAASVSPPSLPLNNAVNVVPHPQGDGSMTLPVVGSGPGGNVPAPKRIFNIPPPPLPPPLPLPSLLQQAQQPPQLPLLHQRRHRHRQQ